MDDVQKKTLLLVEDDPDLLEVLQLTFETDGFRPVLASDGEQALSKARRHAPDLIVLDLMLPKLDGLEVCRQLRADDAFAQVPILMLTAKSDESDVVLGLGLGADDYVCKPARPRELVARVRGLLRRRESRSQISSERKILVGDMVIDPERFEVRVGDGEPIQLTPTEFKLLQTLAARPGRVFRRAELLDGTVGTSVIVTERNIDTHVKSVRRKLAERGSQIETVRGVGYRFSDRFPE
ncbi:MAG: response regulator transcription factor [Planctomycetota bacterium]|jgi:DNA-binding response OmpR family regulator|nr:response regulator transcription factor [Planctomycetota bacterium]